MADPGYELILDAGSGVDRLAFDLRMDPVIVEAALPSFTHGDPLPRRRLFEVHLGLGLLTIFPLNTHATPDFLSSKYPRIQSISVELSNLEGLPENGSDARDFLEANLPPGFVPDPAYGLGVTKEMRPMIAAIEELPGVHYIAIRKGIESRIEGDTFEMAAADFDEMRRAFQRIARKYQDESLADRTLLAHNAIPHRLRPEAFPERSRPYKPGTVFKWLSKETQLRGDDRKGLVDALASNARSIADHDPSGFQKLQRDVELVSLDKLIEEFARRVTLSQPESAWQTLFELNPFILSMVFGYPAVLVAPRASVGGLTLAGNGTKIVDFLMENQGTHNAAIVEIKTPKTKLLGTEYRGGAWRPSRHVTDAIVQVLDQRMKLVSSLPLLKQTSGVSLQAYSVECVIVIGSTPDNEAKRSSFELIRTQFKDVRIVTFDELLGKLRLLRALLGDNGKESSIRPEAD
jgi:hypothetical protein